MSQQSELQDSKEGAVVRALQWLANPQPDRRRHRRFSLIEKITVRQAEPGGTPFEDQAMTLNVSQEGMYFITQQRNYEAGKNVLVTWPGRSKDPLATQQYLARIVRVVELPDGQFGVALNVIV